MNRSRYLSGILGLNQIEYMGGQDSVEPITDIDMSLAKTQRAPRKNYSAIEENETSLAKTQRTPRKTYSAIEELNALFADPEVEMHSFYSF